MGRIILGAFLLLAAPIAFADTLTGKVVKVADGDSITVLDSTKTQHCIRLQDIDAPSQTRSRCVSMPLEQEIRCTQLCAEKEDRSFVFHWPVL